MIPVTKPFLPPKEEVMQLLDGVWQRNWLTNNGPLVNELELELKKYLKLKHLLYVSNGTVALQIALKALNITKEVITTPFSYVATTSSILWSGCTPVFVDIDPDTFTIDPAKIESAITPGTEAILATHCFGNPCDVEAIGEIARKHNLKVIYDAAHCFGTTYKGKNILEWGDISAISFHATKMYHTVEGGAVVAQDAELIRKMAYMRNFGHDGPYKYNGIGINGKNSEFHAAMGLANLKYFKQVLLERQKLSHNYDELLINLRHQKQLLPSDTNYNYSYYPILLENEEILLAIKEELETHEIFPRRYFFPLLSDLDYIENGVELPVAKDVSKRILCLPLYNGLSKEEQKMIARLMLRRQNS